MVNPALSNFQPSQIGFSQVGSNLVAVLPFVLPLLFGGILFLLFQKHLPQSDTKRNVILGIGLLGIGSGAILFVFAAFGSMWWLPGDLTFGSYDTFIAIIQRLNDLAFRFSMVSTMVYLIGTILIFVYMARMVISPPDPDFVALNEKLKDLSSTAGSVQKQKTELESENKQLHEFLKEKEESLANLHSELDALKLSVGERDSSLAEMEARLKEPVLPVEDSSAEQELLETISNKDQTISKLQSELADLRLIMEGSQVSGEAPETPSDITEKIAILEKQVEAAQSKVSDYGRRADTASEVSDSVISDLAELMSQVESSGLDPSAKIALRSLIEGLGRAMGRIAAAPADKDDSPKVELIGAILMVHEIVDAVKKLSRL